jgi:3-deoxy-D-manno-octulosonate 8-phosphate phosphatase (KDO 8-P phosphatase)
MLPTRTLQSRCLAIEFLVLDVDGVLTDGGIVLGGSGLELKEFHVRDGSGLKVWHDCGKRTGLVTGRRSAAVDARAKELGIGFVVQGAGDKWAAFREMLTAAGIGAEAVCCVGDDLPDLPLLEDCGLAVAPGDACPQARAAAHYITRTAGGRGAVRETVELILRSQGTWPTAASGR